MDHLLKQWLRRGQFCSAIERARSACSDDDFWRASNQWLREAILASWIGKAIRARRIRLGEDRNCGPDSEFELPTGAVVKLQHVEALRSGRKRTDEYRKWKATGFAARESEDLAVEISDFPLAVERAAELKAKKAQSRKAKSLPVSDDIGLLIYANVCAWGWEGLRLERELIERTQIASSHFAFVWVWSGDRLYRCWPSYSGEGSSLRPAPHVLGEAMRRHRAKAMLEKIFATDRSWRGMRVRRRAALTPTPQSPTTTARSVE